MMYYKDHNPPHFHIKYGEYRAVFSITELKLIEGFLPTRVVSIVLEWAFLNRDALIEDWQLALEEKPLNPIEPLVK